VVTPPDAGSVPIAASLRPVRVEDLAVFFAHQDDPVAHRMADFPARDHGAFMAHWTKILADPSVTCRTVLVDGDVAGNVMTFDFEGRREVGYWIGRAYWGRGIATHAVAALLDLDPTRPLYAGVAAHNAGSIRVLQKCGFVRYGKDDGHIILVRQG